MDEYFKDLKSLIESSYEKNGRKRVIVIAHSMGCINALYFFNHQTQVRQQ